MFIDSIILLNFTLQFVLYLSIKILITEPIMTGHTLSPNIGLYKRLLP